VQKGEPRVSLQVQENEGKKGRGRKIFPQSRKISKWEETSFLKNAGLLLCSRMVQN
jgi:hypothetical protein